MSVHVSEQSKMPKEPHWAIIGYESQYIEGDERSRTHPGHGYPGHTMSYVSYRAFIDEAEWLKAIDALANPKYGSPKPFTAMHVVPATISTSTHVKVDVRAHA